MDPVQIEVTTGWTVEHVPLTASTNDVAARLVAAGAAARTVVVADRQTRGRGREGRPFLSPVGGLYVSLLLDARPAELPAGLVARVALAVAEAVEAASACPAGIKWPNDIWMDGRKVGGILLEMTDASRPVIAGVGLNIRSVPDGLPEAVREGTAALDLVAGRTVPRASLLTALLRALDAWSARSQALDGAEAVEAAWRSRLVLIGEQIVCRYAGRTLKGVLEDASLAEGLLIRDPLSGPVWRQAEHVQDLRPAARRIA